jgi:hypothetical protein
MPRYNLRTLLVLLAILPPLLWFGWTKYEAWKAEQERQRMLREILQVQSFYFSDLQIMEAMQGEQPRFLFGADPPPVTVPEEPRN